MAIVVSILLALAIQAWWEGRQDRVVERALLDGLHSDFASNRVQLDRMLAIHQEWQFLLGQLANASPDRLSEVQGDSLALFERALQGNATFDARDVTLDAAIASATLGAIQDLRLREMLAEWKAEVEDLEEESAQFRDAAIAARARVAELGGPFTPEISPRGADLVSIAEDQELEDLLRVKRWIGLVYMDYLTPLTVLADSIVTAIEDAAR